jgi:short-subunit dehydrogenase
MPFPTLPVALRIAAFALAIAGTVQFFVLGKLVPGPFFVGALLFGLSFTVQRWRRPVAGFTLALSVLIPIGAIAGYLAGAVGVTVPIFDALVFAWLFRCAWPATRSARIAAADGPRVVLVTGASGGFGSVLGATLVDRGMTVYGTARNPDQRAGDAPFPMLAMEVNDPSSVQKCVDEVIRREGRIDVLVNCVNQMVIGGVEEQTVEEVRAHYDANVFGVLRVCQQVLPTMREQRQGTIVNMSSLGGLLAVPYMSAYTSAKFALEAMTEALYHEVKPHGIDVVIMQPVAMNMDRPATGGHLQLVENVGDGSPSHRMLDRMTKDTAASSLTPETVAAKVHEVITSAHKPLRVPMDRARILTWVRSLAPQAVIDRLIGGLLDG